MGNKVAIGVLVIIVLILIGAGFTWFKNSNLKNSAVPSPKLQISVSPQAVASSDNQKSLQDLVNSGTSQKCSFADSDTKTSGTIYVSAGKIRGDFTSPGEGQTVDSHMITEGQTAYVWTEGATQGMKISIASASTTPATSSAKSAKTNNTPLDISKKTDYKCENWIPDQLLLNVPANIKFNDLSGLTPKVKSSAGDEGDVKVTQCQACDQLSGAAKDQCKKALSC